MPHSLLLWLSWRMDLGRVSSNPSGACARSQASSMWPVHSTLRKLAPTLPYRNRSVHLLILVGRACDSELAVFDWWEAHQPLVGDCGPSVRVSARSAREKRIPYHCAHCYNGREARHRVQRNVSQLTPMLPLFGSTRRRTRKTEHCRIPAGEPV